MQASCSKLTLTWPLILVYTWNNKKRVQFTFTNISWKSICLRFIQRAPSEKISSHYVQCSKVKVKKFQNEYVNSPHCPKYEWKIIEKFSPIVSGQNFSNFFCSYFGQCDDFTYLFWNFPTFSRHSILRKKLTSKNFFLVPFNMLVLLVFYVYSMTTYVLYLKC